MSPSDDRLIADLLAPLISRAESLHREADTLAQEIVALEGALRKRLAAPRFFPKGKGKGGES